MAGKALLAVQYERQYAEAIDKDYKFTTTQRMDYLTNPLRYSGQIVLDTDEDKMYRLNFARNTWLTLGSSSLPDQAGNAGKYLKTDGTTASWETVTSGVSSVNGQTGVVTLTADSFSDAATTNKWFTETRVRATILTGLSLLTSTAITAADSVLSAFGKLQAQITILFDRVVNEYTLRTDPDIQTTSLPVAIRGYVNTITALYTAADGSVPTSTNFTYNYRLSTTSTWTTGVDLATLNTALSNSSLPDKIVWVTATNTTNTVPAAVILTVKQYA